MASKFPSPASALTSLSFSHQSPCCPSYSHLQAFALALPSAWNAFTISSHGRLLTLQFQMAMAASGRQSLMVLYKTLPQSLSWTRT